MAPLIVLIVVTLLARLTGQLGVVHLRDGATSTRVGLAVMFCFTAAAHFNSMRPDMLAITSAWSGGGRCLKQRVRCSTTAVTPPSE